VGRAKLSTQQGFEVNCDQASNRDII